MVIYKPKKNAWEYCMWINLPQITTQCGLKKEIHVDQILNDRFEAK